MTDLIKNKISEAQEILKDLGLPPAQQNKISALTFLALANIKPDSHWKDAKITSMTLTKDIMDFVNRYYKAEYASNSRESFRKIAIKPFVHFKLIDLNPDNPTLSQNSALTHYALTKNTFSTILKFGENSWTEAVTIFKMNQYPENEVNGKLLRKVKIKNYKSIPSDEIELGRFNVFIGENGCGKSNILEALAIVSASKSNDLSFDGLYSRGVRIARPDLMLSSFLGKEQSSSIEISVSFDNNGNKEEYESIIEPENPREIYTKWVDKNLRNSLLISEFVHTELEKILAASPELSLKDAISKFQLNAGELEVENAEDLKTILSEYLIYDLNTKSLRGITPVDSRKTPLGLNGEGLDLLIGNFNAYEREVLNKCEKLFKWLESIVTDKEDKNKLQGLKPGRSSSTLYFTDRYMQKKNNTLSAENSNEGVLHVLFYLALFISNKTPQLFAIDNIETALNPKLCQKLITELASLAKTRGKQVLITTHNPAVLDGLNLLDDEQRLFEVYRNSEGNTKTRRIKFKTDLDDKKFKLSEMWMKGSLGAIPEF
ncbi:AAA family ATPase [Pedobacter alluvionis]|uniref:Putative ATPase n=1 Tax=Pedobacter alluvionis TaxID=475253 RepID=A0A497XT54_9SPHI|nr:AAA family ATPase [Pedobacter alluvionis]RLJ72511.1 putative ATPase [Pedobacter alluvionis]TFB28167.1 hypothetical protein E3V97_24425 [Pedobacter alluvionis]